MELEREENDQRAREMTQAVNENTQDATGQLGDEISILRDQFGADSALMAEAMHKHTDGVNRHLENTQINAEKIRQRTIVLERNINEVGCKIGTAHEEIKETVSAGLGGVKELVGGTIQEIRTDQARSSQQLVQEFKQTQTSTQAVVQRIGHCEEAVQEIKTGVEKGFETFEVEFQEVVKLVTVLVADKRTPNERDPLTGKHVEREVARPII